MTFHWGCLISRETNTDFIFYGSFFCFYLTLSPSLASPRYNSNSGPHESLPILITYNCIVFITLWRTNQILSHIIFYLGYVCLSSLSTLLSVLIKCTFFLQYREENNIISILYSSYSLVLCLIERKWYLFSQGLQRSTGRLVIWPKLFALLCMYLCFSWHKPSLNKGIWMLSCCVGVGTTG